MEYLTSLALLVLNLIDYEHDLGHGLFFVMSSIIFGALIFFVHRKTHNFLATCIIMMCHTWQISWINIFGDPTENLQLPWFYIIGVMIVFYAVFDIGKSIGKSYKFYVLIMFFTVFVSFTYPLFIATSVYEGLKEYLMIGFYVVILFCAYIYKDDVPKSCYDQIKRAFIWASFSTSVFLIFQYIMYSQFGIVIFKLRLSIYFNHSQISYRLLMEDHSCSTIMIGCSAFYLADRINKKNWYINVPALVIILAALALTSRRTSTVTLAAVSVLYILFHFKGLGKKLVFTLIFGVGIAVMIYYLLIVRPVDNIVDELYDNGRLDNYSAAIDIIIDHPFGVGYDANYLASLMPNNLLPHNTLLRWLCMGGYLFAIPIVVLIAYVARSARMKKMSCEFWAIVYTMMASNFIPDVLNARFFIIPCAVVFLVDMGGAPPEALEEEPEEDAEPVTERVPAGRIPPGRILPGKTRVTAASADKADKKEQQYFV